MKSNANKSGFFNGINDFFKQESEIGSFKQFCFKSVNLSKVERERRKQQCKNFVVRKWTKSNRSWIESHFWE